VGALSQAARARPHLVLVLGNDMKRVIIESPYAGDVWRNTAYARACVRDSLRRGEAPIASHLLYTQPGILDDDVETERELGIAAGLAWRKVAELFAFYIDYGWSSGMSEAYAIVTGECLPFEVRRIIVEDVSEARARA
jgi:hypothetical protein